MRLPVPSAVVTILLGGLLLLTGAAAAATAPRASRASATPSGQPSPAPSAASQAAALAQLTGLTPQQVSTRRACPPPAADQAACAAHIAILRSNGAPVRPRVHPLRTLDDVHATPHPRVGPVLPPGSGAAPGATAAPASSQQAAPAPGTPAWLQQAYDLSYLSATQGQGDTIAVIDAYDDPTAESDLATFRTEYGLPSCTTANGCFNKVNEWGAGSPLPAADAGWETEEALDLDAISSLCPNCHIILVEAASSYRRDLSQAMQTGVDLGANQLSDSWSIVSSSPPRGTYSWPNVATVAAGGDNGYLGTSGDAYPAAMPGVTAAGGTTLAAAASGARGYGESAWSGTGSGCDVSESKPAYQTDTGCTGRAYVDVSADADPTTGLGIYDSGSGGWMLVGGTSLATPLVAAYDAITGVNGSTPQWAYTDSWLLNDPLSGSDGTCDPGISYICTAGPGYDGPTGIGSISGQVTTGGPGIGGATGSNGSSYATTVSSTSAALAGGVYPNGNDTTYWWEYGTSTAYGQQTKPVDIGTGNMPVTVSDTLSGLSSSTTYHYRLVAANSAGTTFGYDYTLTTPAAPVQSQPGSGTTTGTTQSSTSPDPASTTPVSTTPSTPVPPASTTGTTPTPVSTQPAPVSTSAAPPRSTAPIAPGRAPAPALTVAPRLSGAARVGATLRVAGGAYRNGTITSVEFERCAHTCTVVARGPSPSRTLSAADAGYYMRAWITVSGPGGSTSTWASGTIGPIRSTAAGAAVLQLGADTIRGTTGRPLAHVSTSRRRTGARAQASSRSGGVRSSVVFTRVGAVRDLIRVWACVLPSAATPSCTSPRTVRRVASLSLTLRADQRAELIAVAPR